MKLKSVIILSLLFSAVTLFAQDKPDEKPVKVGGQLYLFYGYEFNNASLASSNHERSEGFTVDRARVTVTKEFDPVFKVNVAIEGNNTASAANNTNTTASVFVRLANIEANLLTGEDIKVRLLAGLISSPIIEAIDQLSGLRWLGKNFYDNAAALNVYNTDYTFGGGILAAVEILKMVKITGTVMNGGNTTGAQETYENSGKSFHGVVSVTPVEKLITINGYVNSFDLAVKNTALGIKGEYQLNYGGSAAINISGIVLGGNFFFINKKDTTASGSTDIVQAKIAEGFMNANFKEISGIPLFLIGRFGYGKDTKLANSEAIFYAAGIGYQFNSNLQMAAYFENYNYKTALGTNFTGYGSTQASNRGKGTQQNLYIKSEAKF